MDQPTPGRKADTEDLSARSAEEVFREHLALRQCGKVERDIQRNYAPDIVMLTTYGVFHGHDGVRKGAKMLKEQLGDAEVTYVNTLVNGEMAFLEWTAHSDRVCVEDGADSFLIRNGKIVAKTFHYTVKKPKPSS